VTAAAVVIVRRRLVVAVGTARRLPALAGTRRPAAVADEPTPENSNSRRAAATRIFTLAKRDARAAAAYRTVPQDVS
jgi:hypothetical protein